jgi:hypothetical protein
LKRVTAMSADSPQGAWCWRRTLQARDIFPVIRQRANWSCTWLSHSSEDQATACEVLPLLQTTTGATIIQAPQDGTRAPGYYSVLACSQSCVTFSPSEGSDSAPPANARSGTARLLRLGRLDRSCLGRAQVHPAMLVELVRAGLATATTSASSRARASLRSRACGSQMRGGGRS